MVRAILFFLILVINLSSFAQISSSYPFVDGEEVDYTVYYNLSFVWVNAASVNFCVKDSSYKDKSAIFFSSTGISNSSYDWIFRVRDSFTSFVSPEQIRPLTFHRITEEGSEKKNNYYLFDGEGQKIYSFIQDEDKPLKKDTLEAKSIIYDVLSATYYLRTIDFPKYNIGDTIPVKAVIDNQIIKLEVIYLGKENVLHKNTKTYQSYKFKTKGVEGSVFDDNSEIFVWVSADENKIPLKIESEILVGSVKAYINTVKKPKQETQIIKDFIVE